MALKLPLPEKKQVLRVSDDGQTIIVGKGRGTVKRSGIEPIALCTDTVRARTLKINWN